MRWISCSPEACDPPSSEGLFGHPRPVDHQLHGHSRDLLGREGTKGGGPDGARDRAPPPTLPLVAVERAAP